MVKYEAAGSQGALGLMPRVLVPWVLLVLLKRLGYFWG